MYGKGLRPLSILTCVALTGAFALAFFYAPMDTDQGISQKIFYVHVPLAIVTLVGFVIGGIYGILHLRSGDRAYDVKSYVAIHLSLILAIGALVTGSIWAHAAWGHWWVWDEPTLVSFLIVFLLYCCYQPLRFSIEDPDRQARYASVFAITAGAFVPLNFIAVRLAQEYAHPRVLGSTDSLPPKMRVAFLASLIAMGLLYATLWRLELTAKHTRNRLHSLRRRVGDELVLGPIGGAAMILASSVLPGDSGYVAAAYLVFLVLILGYVAIMAIRAARLERDVVEIAELIERRDDE